ncbi:MAG TPA: tetratricopeptide repeat protein [Pyrinomonadaceae bacterium]
MLIHSHLKWRYLLVALLLSLYLVRLVVAQTSTISDSESQTGLGGMNSIIGTVFAPSGRPLESRVRIRLSTMTRGDRIFTTNEHGNFAFRGLPTGSYTISIDKEADYKPYSQSVDVRQFRGGPATIITLNVRLEFKDRVAAKPGVVSAEFLSVPKKALIHYDSAIELAKKGEHNKAIDELKLAIAEHQTFAQAFNELGVQYLRLNRLEEADASFQQALKINPELFSALMNRGIANVLMKRYGEAVPILRRALVKDEKSAVGHYFLGQALANLGLFDDAEKQLLASLDLGREQMKEAHRVLAIIYASRGARKQAVEHLETYLKLSPEAPDAEKLKEMIRKLKEPESQL